MKSIFRKILVVLTVLMLCAGSVFAAEVSLGIASDRYFGYIPVQTYFEASFDGCTADNFASGTWLETEVGRLDVANGSSRVYSEELDHRGYCLRIQTNETLDSAQLRFVPDANGSTSGSNPAMKSGVYRLKFDFKFMTPDTARELMMFHPAGNPADKYREKYFLSTRNSDGSVSKEFRAFGSGTGIEATAGRWYSAEYIFDYEKDVTSIGIDGIYFSDDSVEEYDYFRPFAYAGKSDFTYYDNIILQKIEPSGSVKADNLMLKSSDGSELVTIDNGFKISCDVSNTGSHTAKVTLAGAVYNPDKSRLEAIFLSDSVLEPDSDAVRLEISADSSEYEGRLLRVMVLGGESGIMPLVSVDGDKVRFDEYSELILMFEGSRRAACFGDISYMEAAPFEMNGVHYIPVGFVLDALGAEVCESSGIVRFDGSLRGSISKNVMTAEVNGKSVNLTTEPVESDGCVYVSSEDIEAIIGRKCAVQNYFVAIGYENRIGKVVSKSETSDYLFRKLLIDRPTKKQLYDKVKKTHPRIMADDTTFPTLRKYKANGDKMAGEWITSVLSVADKALSEANVSYVLADGLRLKNNENLGHINELSFAYALTGEAKYAKKAWLQIAKVCNFPDWNSDAHFLDTSGIMQTMAIAYDWLYNYLNDAQKKIMLTAIRQKGLEPALNQYESNAFWVNASHNWNAVCNSGAAKLAIAVADEPELTELALEVLSRSFDSIGYVLGDFRPDGAWREGVGYWYYMNRSLVQYMWTLEKAYGTTFGIADVPGMAETGYFPAYMTGPNGIFNVSEGDAYTWVDAPEIVWFASYYGDNALRKLRYDTMLRQGFDGTMIDLLLYEPVNVDGIPELPTDKYYRGLEAAVIQTGWDDADGVYFGLAGGSNGYNHGHMDVGMFTFDANGVRWAIGLGGDNYNLDGYFDQAEGGATWNYYRLRAEGHNTLVINPDSGGGQRVSKSVVSPIIRFETDSYGGIAVTDMTRNYDTPSGTQVAKSLLRGAKVNKNTGVITVQDEIKLNSSGDVYWFMHTEADISLSGDGKTAILSEGEKQCTVYLNSDVDAVFEVMDAIPLETSPNPPGQNANSGFRKLTIKLTGVQNALLCVTFDAYGALESMPSCTPMASWSLAEFK